MEWIVFSVLAAVVWAAVNIVDKYILTRLIRKPVIFLMILGLVGLIFSVLIYFFKGLQDLNPLNIYIALLAGLFYLLMCYFYFKAAQIEEISRVVPLLYIDSLFVMLLAFVFLDEVFTPIKYAAIILLIAGAFILSYNGISKGKALLLMLLSAICLALNHVLTKYLLGFADFWTIFSWSRVGVVIALLPVFFYYYKDLFGTLKRGKVFCLLSLNETLNALGILLITIAASYGYITLVNALSSLQPLFVLIFAFFISIYYPKILREELGKATFVKLLGIIFVLCGAGLISYF